MKTESKPLAIAILAAFAAAHAAVPLRWNVETSRAQPASFDVYRGETLELHADLLSYARPIETAGAVALYVQTNGMDDAWWIIPATAASNRIEAVLSPTDYPGDAQYLNCFLGGPATSYRAAFRLRVLGSPGSAPNTVSPPVVTLDYDAITVLNPPYWTRAEADARYGGISITADVVTNVAAAVVARDALPKADGEAHGLTVGGEFRLTDGSGGVGTIQYAGNDQDNSSDWYVGVHGYWLGQYRLRHPGPLDVATVAFTSDLAPYAAASSVASNALQRTEAAQTYATKAEMTTGLSTKLDATGGTAYDLSADSQYDDKLYVGSSGDTYANVVFGQALALVYDGSERWLAVLDYPSPDYGNLDHLALFSELEDLAEFAEEEIGYAKYYTLAYRSSYQARANSVQYITLASGTTSLSIAPPEPVSGRVRDWVVYLYPAADVTLSFAATAHWYSSAAAGVKSAAAGKITRFAFSEIGYNASTGKPQFSVVKTELQEEIQ